MAPHEAYLKYVIEHYGVKNILTDSGESTQLHSFLHGIDKFAKRKCTQCNSSDICCTALYWDPAIFPARSQKHRGFFVLQRIFLYLDLSSVHSQTFGGLGDGTMSSYHETYKKKDFRRLPRLLQLRP